MLFILVFYSLIFIRLTKTKPLLCFQAFLPSFPISSCSYVFLSNVLVFVTISLFVWFGFVTSLFMLLILLSLLIQIDNLKLAFSLSYFVSSTIFSFRFPVCLQLKHPFLFGVSLVLSGSFLPQAVSVSSLSMCLDQSSMECVQCTTESLLVFSPFFFL